MMDKHPLPGTVNCPDCRFFGIADTCHHPKRRREHWDYVKGRLEVSTFDFAYLYNLRGDCKDFEHKAEVLSKWNRFWRWIWNG